MSIKFTNLKIGRARTIRPVGYEYPKGLSSQPFVEPNNYITTTGTTVNAYYDGAPDTVPTRVSYSWETSGTFSFEYDLSTNHSLTADVLIVAGGGAGHTSGPGQGGQSGGGAGGLLYYSDSNGLTGPPGPASANSKSPNGPAISLAPGVNFAVVVGAGGAGQGDTTIGIGNGGDSSVANTSPYVPSPEQLNLVATGGGSQPDGISQPGQPGGSGSGVYGGYNPVGQGISGQGNPGAGPNQGGLGYSGGGGGGAGGPGSDHTDLNLRSGKDGNPAPTSMPGFTGSLSPYDNAYRYASGGDGYDFDISGTRRTYAAGGGGSGRGYGWFGGSDNLGGRGSGGGTAGGSTPSPWNTTDAGGNGTISRGSGGGGGTSGGFGGGGVVIIQFNKGQTVGIYSIN